MTNTNATPLDLDAIEKVWRPYAILTGPENTAGREIFRLIAYCRSLIQRAEKAKASASRSELSAVAKALAWEGPYQASLAMRVESLIAGRASATEERDTALARIKTLETERDDLQDVLDLTMKADMRGIAMWREKTGKELHSPDGGRLTCWLIEQHEAAAVHAQKLETAILRAAQRFDLIVEGMDDRTIDAPPAGTIELYAAELRAALSTTEAQPQAQSNEQLFDALKRALLNYRCSFTASDDGEGYPLSDKLTPPDDTEITRGLDEIDELADALVAAVGVWPQPDRRDQRITDLENALGAFMAIKQRISSSDYEVEEEDRAAFAEADAQARLLMSAAALGKGDVL